MAVKLVKPYKAVSIIYRELMKEVDYKLWGDYLIDIIRENLNTHYPSVLELGAGDCRIAEIIIATYPEYLATDISFEMLKQHKKDELKQVCCDMTFLPFKQKFDLIISTFDSVNYLLTEKKLLCLFNQVKNVLTRSGIFTFDVSLEKNSEDFKNSYEIKSSVDGYHFVRKSKYNPDTRIHKNTFKIMDRTGSVKKEIHKQKIYKFNTYFRLIEKAGLFVVECLDAFSFNNANPNCERVQFILKIDKSKC